MKLFSLTNILTVGATASVATGSGTLIYFQITNPNNTLQQSVPQTEQELQQEILKAMDKNAQIFQGKKNLEELVDKKESTSLMIQTLSQEIKEADVAINNWKIAIDASSTKLSNLEKLKSPTQQSIDYAQSEYNKQEAAVREEEKKVHDYQQEVDKAIVAKDTSLLAKGAAEIALFTHLANINKLKKDLEDTLAKIQNLTMQQAEQSQQETQKTNKVNEQSRLISEKESSIQQIINTYLNSTKQSPTTEQTKDTQLLRQQLNDLDNFVPNEVTDETVKKSIQDAVENLKQLKSTKTNLDTELKSIKVAKKTAEDGLIEERQKQQNLNKTTTELSNTTSKVNDDEANAKQDYAQKKTELDTANQTQLQNKTALLSCKHNLRIKQSELDKAKEKQQQLLTDIEIETKNQNDLKAEQKSLEKTKQNKEDQIKQLQAQLLIDEESVKQQEQAINDLL